MEITTAEEVDSKSKYVTMEDIKLIVSKQSAKNGESFIENYVITNASDKMLGFLCDYWKLLIHLGPHKKVLQFFLKVMSVTNVAKAKMVQELKLFEKELYFYAVIKQRIEIPDLRPWSAGFITDLRVKAMVFQDMNALQYKLRDKFKRLDMAHTLEALRTLARFHASSIIYEEHKSKELGRNFSLNEEFHEHLGDSGYTMSNTWVIQCMDAALNAIKLFANISDEQKNKIESCWYNIWASAMDLANASAEYRNVICHRDLWNNNLMFHYKKVGHNMVPDDCILVDFQSARYQPPAGDVMQLLYCNLEPKFREENLEMFLDAYLKELEIILSDHEMESGIMNRNKFFESAYKHRQWGAIIYASLLPQFWIDDDLTTKIFCDADQFCDILSKNKPAFVIKMMQSNPDYKEKLMDIFMEIAERYCV